ncbi:cobalamin-binding protein [candidate division LCP-89 bacterium B3_LCP]|uniref:Cobalamin-binding protein n=1 Tax=candidate division LCP-89 bacterium B3_LCP TaxID=2012998 RepID=A0A532UTX9_UNCL8|nr:MAG: cobalamin-binding protein [candidate division LCP-89 bacterium B3_LCP]
MSKPNQEIHNCILDGDAGKTKILAEKIVNAGSNPTEALQPFITAIRHAGDLFDQGEFFLPQLLLSAKAMQAAMDVMFPSSEGKSAARLSRGTVIAGTIQGDIHEIGKNLVCALLSAHGFQVVDLGADVALDRFVQETEQHKPDFLVLSALLTTTMINQKHLIDQLNDKGIRDGVKVLVGGAPVTSDWAEEIGADGYAPDASRAVALAIKLLDA